MRNFTLSQLAYTLSCVLTMHAAQLWPPSCRMVTVKTDFYAVLANITNTTSFVRRPASSSRHPAASPSLHFGRHVPHVTAVRLWKAVTLGEFSLLAAGIPCRRCLAVGAKNFASQFYEYACLGVMAAATPAPAPAIAAAGATHLQFLYKLVADGLQL